MKTRTKLIGLLCLLGLTSCGTTPTEQAKPTPTATELPQVQAAREKINQAVQQDADSLKKMDQTENNLQTGNSP